MTNEQLKKELKEKVKEGVKPSDIKRLKRSKSADDIKDIPSPPPLPPTCNRCPELQKQLDKVNDDWLELAQKTTQALKDWDEQRKVIKKLSTELNSILNEASEEINKSGNKNIKLQRQLREAQSKLKLIESDLNTHQRAAEFRLANPYKDKDNNFWEDYGLIIILLGLYALSYWLLKTK